MKGPSYCPPYRKVSPAENFTQNLLPLTLGLKPETGTSHRLFYCSRFVFPKYQTLSPFRVPTLAGLCSRLKVDAGFKEMRGFGLEEL